MGELAVRRARPHEFERIGELRVRAYIEGGVVSPDLPYVEQLRAVAEQAAAAELLVAVGRDDGEEVLGVVTVAQPPSPEAQIARAGEAEFRMLATDPSARGRGVGETLVHAVLRQAKERGLRRVVISVVEDNMRAIKLYERLGFQRIPERDWDLRSGEELRLIAFSFELA